MTGAGDNRVLRGPRKGAGVSPVLRGPHKGAGAEKKPAVSVDRAVLSADRPPPGVLGRRALACWVLSLLACLPLHRQGGAALAREADNVFAEAGVSWAIRGPLKGIMSHAAACGDVDSDGDLDVFVGTFCDRPAHKYRGRPGPVPNVLLRNEGGLYRDSGEDVLAVAARTSGAVFADLDNDGDLDLYITNNSKSSQISTTFHIENRLYENVGGSFRDVSKGNGACVAMGGRSIAAFDYDGDGLLDLLATEDRWCGGRTKLFRNRGALAFEDVTRQAGLPEVCQGLGAVTPDLNEDGRPDIFVSGANRLFLSDSRGGYRAADSSVFQYKLGREAEPCGVTYGDLDRDGDTDLVVVDHSRPGKIHLFLNRGLRKGVPVFEDATAKAGLVYDCPVSSPECPAIKHAHVEIRDFDNDGWPDVMVGVTYREGGAVQPFVCWNRGVRGGTVRFRLPPVEKSLAYFPAGAAADFDRDGRIDVFLASWFPEVPSCLLLNRCPERHWLRVEVRPRKANRMGIGSKVRVYEAGRLGEPRALLGFVEIGVNHGYCSGQEAAAHFGLGDTARCDVEVTLPFDGGVIRKKGVPADRVLLVTE